MPLVMPTPRRSTLSGSVIRWTIAASGFALSVGTSGYIGTTEKLQHSLDEYDASHPPGIFLYCAAEVVRLFNMIPRERWELVMLYSAVFAALFGFLLAFGAERDGDRLTRWRASLTFAVTSTEMLTAPEAGLLLMPEEPDTGWARWFRRPKRRLVGRRLVRVFPNGRSASLYFSHNAALTVADLSTATTRYQTYDYTWPARDRQDQASVILG